MSDSIQLSFSSSNLGDLPMHAYSNDFTFLVGTNSYPCPSFISDLLSPHISKLRSADPTIREFSIQTPDPRDDFSSFLSLGSGQSVRIDSNNSTFFHSLARELGSVDIFRSVFRANGGTLNCTNVIDQLVILCELDGDYELEVEFCATHFHELSSSSLSDLPFPLLAAIHVYF
jgi:hypothetical protein